MRHLLLSTGNALENMYNYHAPVALRRCTFEPLLWDSHSSTASEKVLYRSRQASLDLLLECSNWKSFHNCLCWLCLHLGLLTKNHLSARLGGWLGPCLDAAEAWDRKHTCLFDLLCGNGHEAVQHIGASLRFQAMLSGNRLQQSTLCHCLGSTSFHGLHWRQHGVMRRDESANNEAKVVKKTGVFAVPGLCRIKTRT